MLKEMQVISQLDKKFIITSIKCDEKTMIIAIDQHAAHERIRLEDLRKKALNWREEKENPIVRSQVMEPSVGLDIELNECILLKKYQEKLNSWCWRFNVAEDTLSTNYER
jgi:DNA mismatch repair ATPase MutL